MKRFIGRTIAGPLARLISWAANRKHLRTTYLLTRLGNYLGPSSDCGLTIMKIYGHLAKLERLSVLTPDQMDNFKRWLNTADVALG